MSRFLFVTVFISTWIGGCSPAVPAPDPGTAMLDGFHIGTCQTEGRLAKAHDAGPGEAWLVYDKCMRDYGFRGPQDGGLQ